MNAPGDPAKAALWFVDLGFKVFPVWSPNTNGECGCPLGSKCVQQQRAKHPANKNGFLEATDDKTQIRTFLGNPGTQNYGLVCPEGVIAIDVDGEAGINRWLELQETLGIVMPPTLTTKTANGYHFFFSTPDGHPSGKAFDFVVRDHLSGYVIGPGSKHASGDFYSLLGKTTDIAELPQSFLDAWMGVEASKNGHEPLFTTSEEHVGYVVPETVSEGRYDAIRDYVASQYNRGLSKEAIFGAMKAELAPRFAVALTEEELRSRFNRTYKDIGKRLGPPATSRRATSSAAMRTAAIIEADSRGSLVTKPLSAFTMREMQWLWYGWLPRGVVTLLDGNPGEGKSTLVMDLIARITTGSLWPDGTPCTRGRVLYITREDDPATTLLPRLMAAGGDSSMISVVDEEFVMPEDQNRLLDLVTSESWELVVIDPLFSHIGADVKTISDNDVRVNVMTPLGNIADKGDAALLVLRHNSKAVGSSAVMRGAGSLGGIMGAARQALAVVTDPDTEDGTKVFGVTKSNYAKTDLAMKYRIVGEMLPGWTRSVSKTEWLGDSALSINDILTEEDHVKGSRAADVLTDILRGRTTMDATEVFSRMKAKGFSEKAVRGGQKRLGIIPVRVGYGPGGKWVWFLPSPIPRA